MLETLARLGRFASFGGRLVSRSVHPPWNGSDFFVHTFRVCLRCVGPVCATTLPFGMVMALQGLVIFDLFGAQRMLAPLVVSIVVRELSPLMACVLVAAQGGSAFAAELGAMRIKEELDATEVMAVDSLSWHVAPRVLALILACPILHILGSVAGIAGGYIMAVWLHGEPSGTYLQNLWGLTVPRDLLGGILKTTTFGGLIGLIACYHGFNASGGAAGVGRGVNDTVVQSVLAIFGANYLISSLLVVR